MELLLNPDVAYVILVVGFLLGLLAIVTPGTGLLEVGAVFLLVLAGWAAYHIHLNLWAVIVLALSIVPFVYALRSARWKLFLILSLVGFLAGSLYIFPSKGLLPVVNPFVAVIVSLLSVGSIWFVTTKTIQAHNLPLVHDPHSLVGMTGETKTHIQDSGSVQIASELWSARSKVPIPAGKQVRVTGIDGFILEVEPVSEPGE